MGWGSGWEEVKEDLGFGSFVFDVSTFQGVVWMLSWLGSRFLGVLYSWVWGDPDLFDFVDLCR